MDYITVFTIDSRLLLLYNSVMDLIKKPEGFKGEKIIVLPRIFLQEASLHPLVRPVYPTDIGFFPDAEYHYRERPDGSEQNVLIYCTKGEGFVEAEGKKRIIRQNTLLMIPRGIPHTYGSCGKKPWTIFWVHFLGSNAEDYFIPHGRGFSVLPVPIEKHSMARSLFIDILECLEKGYTQETMVYISQVLAHLLGSMFFMTYGYKMGLKEENSRIEESIHFMSKNLALPLSLKELAVQANLSPTHYSCLFKKRTGFSPIDYFIRLKIQKACQYLDMTALKVNVIAKKLGFQDPYYFSRTFSKIMQLSPSGYRDIKKG